MGYAFVCRFLFAKPGGGGGVKGGARACGSHVTGAMAQTNLSNQLGRARAGRLAEHPAKNKPPSSGFVPNPPAQAGLTPPNKGRPGHGQESIKELGDKVPEEAAKAMDQETRKFRPGGRESFLPRHALLSFHGALLGAFFQPKASKGCWDTLPISPLLSGMANHLVATIRMCRGTWNRAPVQYAKGNKQVMYVMYGFADNGPSNAPFKVYGSPTVTQNCPHFFCLCLCVRARTRYIQRVAVMLVPLSIRLFGPPREAVP